MNPIDTNVDSYQNNTFFTKLYDKHVFASCENNIIILEKTESTKTNESDDKFINKLYSLLSGSIF